ncbi:hypothetical protein H4R18_003793 [Coemansia javaensis]|uniref:Uncharacterized protein n=1 Tax=Coemansia javaensis TaxID=2761396 RepID=A0A9W8HDJ3_9FUNG|nr:hypothetical protein H4R18_003793 [Coemansia javaensis]
MQVLRYDAEGNKVNQWASCRRGENFLFIVFYTAVGLVYCFMGAAIIAKKDDRVDDIANKMGDFGKFSYGISVTADFSAALMVFGWIWMCIYRRQKAIVDYTRHPKTNIGVEILFLATHICFIVSDRVFIHMLPSTIDFYEVMYPVAMTFVLLMAILIVYLVLKYITRACKGASAET